MKNSCLWRVKQRRWHSGKSSTFQLSKPQRTFSLSKLFPIASSFMIFFLVYVNFSTSSYQIVISQKKNSYFMKSLKNHSSFISTKIWFVCIMKFDFWLIAAHLQRRWENFTHSEEKFETWNSKILIRAHMFTRGSNVAGVSVYSVENGWDYS